MPGFVLIVDDNAIDRSAMARVLQGEGFQVATARDGRVALDILDSARPDLILLDMVIPSGFDGWFFLGQRQYHGVSDIPLLIVTGLNIADESWALGLGANGFLKKPLDVDHLIEEVRRLVALRCC
jgi:CheY-like chemotaxis protein